MKKYVSAEELKNRNTPLTLEDVRNAIEDYAPLYMHGIHRDKYIKVLNNAIANGVV